MKRIRNVIASALVVGALVSPTWGFAADTQSAKAKPYPLKTCVVSGEKLGEMGDPYVFVHKGQEVKLCCKSCLKDFNKNPDKYLKKMAEKPVEKKK